MEDAQYSLSFMKPSPSRPFASDGSFGALGSGGSLGLSHPEAGIVDPHDLALRNEVYSIIPPAS